MDYLVVLKDIVQIVFWLLAGVLAVLTYRQARRTVLQPIRTEVFKEQLKVMSEVMSLFVGKSEVPLREDFKFYTLFNANACYLLDSYAASVFDMRFDPDKRLYNSTDCPMKIHTIESIKKTSGSQDGSGSALYSQVYVGDWSLHEVDRLYLNKQCCEMTQRITQLLENPLLPSRMVELLSEYLKIVGNNQSILMRLLEKESKSLAAKFPSLHDMGGHAVWSRDLLAEYMKEFEHFKPVADEIVKFVRCYFGTDNLKRL